MADRPDSHRVLVVDDKPNILDVLSMALRKKLDAHGPSLIHTVRGVGCALRAPRAG